MIKRVAVLTVFLLAILLATLVRGYKLGEAPRGLYVDEAGQGYSAYSILKTGKDEFGKSFPIVFRSFTDFKTPVYVYLIVPLIPFFDLTPLTVRLPSFIFSILTLPVIFLLIRKISPKEIAIPLALITTLLLSISPWHVLFGRTNFECNVALFFFLAGVLAFYKSLEKPAFIVFSAVLFAIAIPAYHSQRVITPLMLLFLFLKHREKLLSTAFRKSLIASVVVFFLILLPTLIVATTPGFLARASGLNIFSYSKYLPSGYISESEGILASLVNIKPLLSFNEFTSLYVSYFSPRNMFDLGDYGPRSSFPELATFYFWQFPFYMYGLYKLVTNNKLKELRALTLALLFITPIPAAVTRDPYSTIRSLPLVIPQLVIISLGIIYFVSAIKTKTKYATYGITLAGILLVIYSIGKLYSSVIILNEYFRASSWDYGWKEVAETINDFNLPVVLDNSRNEPYIEILFFKKYDPSLYQSNNQEVKPEEYYTKMDRVTNIQIGNITTRPIDWETDIYSIQYLVGDTLSISPGQIEEHKMTLIKEIKYPDNKVAFRIVKTNPKEKCISTKFEDQKCKSFIE